MEKTTSSLGSSIRRYSLSISSHGSHHHNIDNDAAESESVVSEVGDIGDRALRSRRFSESNSIRLSFDNRSENGVDVDVVYNQEEQRLQPHSSFSHPNSSVRPFPSELTSTSPLSTHAIVGSEHPNQEPRKGLPVFLDYASCMVQLAVFGILGVFTRYLLQKLFGPGNAAVTSNHTLLYLDLPSNMVGSFLMGWFGVVFKGDIISNVSENLAIAITTGYLGSLTTFSGWNQKMLELAVSGHWLYSALGFLIGMFLVAYSIIFGIKTAKGFRWLLKKMNISSGNGNFKIKSKLESCSSQFNVMVFFMVILVILWSVSGALVKSEFKHGGSAAQLWFACLVSPIGVWIRWFLARLNGRGLGKAGLFKWIPFGTLIANVSAACVMAALSSLKEAVNSRDCDTVVGGIQFGVMGCLSTVSTFASEFNAMSESNQPWKADAYAIITICVSFSLGILIYGVPVWTKGFNIEA